MAENKNCNESSDAEDGTNPTARHGSIFATWVGFYLTAATLLVLTMPATSHSPNGQGILIAFFLLMFGAFRMARIGASASTAFVYGCSTAPLFLFRFLSMGRFSLWLEYRAPSISVIVASWIVICLLLGFLAMISALVAIEGSEPLDDSIGRQA